MLENLTAMEMMESMTMVSIEQLFQDGLARANSLVTVTALKVLAKREEHFRIYVMVMETFFGDKKPGIPLNSGDFCMLFGQSLMELRKSDYVLWRIGRGIVLAKEHHDYGNPNDLEYYKEEDLVNDLGASLMLPSKNVGEGYTKDDLKVLNKEHFQYRQYTQDLLMLGIKHREFRLVESMAVYTVLERRDAAKEIEAGMERFGYKPGDDDTEKLARILIGVNIKLEFRG